MNYECQVCHGEGVRHTGIDECPTTNCEECEGFGYLCEHEVAGNCDECEAEAQQEIHDQYAEYYASVL